MNEQIKKRAVVVLSGGQDSTTCLYLALSKGYEVFAITFAYAQKHSVEIACARMLTAKNNIPHNVVDISFLAQLSDSGLVNYEKSVTELNEKSLPNSFVPNRNQLFFTIAHAFAQQVGASVIFLGASQVDYSGYPDCREPFLMQLKEVTNLGSMSDISLELPLINLSKAETFALADSLGVLEEVINNTHTCYNGIRDENYWGAGCGKCPACEIRKKGFDEYKESTRAH